MSIFARFEPLFLFIIIIISFAIAACSNSPQAAQTIIDRIANDMKTQLPKLLDKDTKLVNVYTKELELVSEYELLNFESNVGNKFAAETKIELYLKSQVCPSIKKELLSKGISSRYIYNEKDGQYLFEEVLKPGDC